MPRQLVLYIAKGGSDASSGSSWAPDDYTPVDVGLRSTFLFLFFSMCTILSGQSNLHRRDNEATRYKIYIKGRNPKLTGTIRLVDHGLNDSTPGVDKPGGEKRKISPIINKAIINYF
jgi:hypothetical protein